MQKPKMQKPESQDQALQNPPGIYRTSTGHPPDA
jgi:hypothetical protein